MFTPLFLRILLPENIFLEAYETKNADIVTIHVLAKNITLFLFSAEQAPLISLVAGVSHLISEVNSDF